MEVLHKIIDILEQELKHESNHIASTIKLQQALNKDRCDIMISCPIYEIEEEAIDIRRHMELHNFKKIITDIINDFVGIKFIRDTCDKINVSIPILSLNEKYLFDDIFDIKIIYTMHFKEK